MKKWERLGVEAWRKEIANELQMHTICSQEVCAVYAESFCPIELDWEEPKYVVAEDIGYWDE